ncbi:uncharacterized protein N7483_006218 [Penicillium malachiteum]|uniref:uncharacterized protein n=1 Tax=Penicillium malachiteum TaxID=1324776 RepID=UPI0025487259|nr:uncharacterized protein N7483_006218 [Penicillium malachiteum]KAJ5731710.1 hypothetical protein N7483_006218 [Penicillium malachiteum]
MSTEENHEDSKATLKTRQLLRGEITYEQALDSDNNMLIPLGYRDQKLEMYLYFNRHRKEIKTAVAHHLGISVDRCHIAKIEDWIHGSFNVCLRIDVDSSNRNHLDDPKINPEKQCMLRFPLFFGVGENICPGNADEKVRCEAATYAWLQENCPTIPIPQLHGFGLLMVKPSLLLTTCLYSSESLTVYAIYFSIG